MKSINEQIKQIAKILDEVMTSLYPCASSASHSKLFALSSSCAGATLKYHGFGFA